MSTEPHDGKRAVECSGFSYFPRFITAEEAEALIEYFGSLTPLWERRHPKNARSRRGQNDGLLTRPVYWLGAWQFACLGYYAEPHYREARCLRAEPFPLVMSSILERLVPALVAHDTSGAPELLPNSCLINYYGSDLSSGQPKDLGRLRMHRDGEPGPVIMFCLGQPGLLEFVDPENDPRELSPELAVWTRHRSITIISGADFKDRLYHRISRVRHGLEPKLKNPVDDFRLRRISVSFRHVPEALVGDLHEFPAEARAVMDEYVEQLAEHSPHFEAQLNEAR